jgi:hypothetical protein
MPLYWKDLLAKARGDNILLWRTPDVSKAYLLKSASLNAIYARYSDFIKIKYLGWETIKRSDGLLESQRTPKSLSIRLTYNAYPYDLDHGIDHYVLWCVDTPPLDLYETVHKLLSNVDKCDIIAHVNYDHERSIMDLWHCQVFIRHV